ncbi:MAG: hypothetical protein ACRBN8_31780 [Nannocystales bacterium]
MSVLRTAWNTRWVYLLTLGLTLGWAILGGSLVAWMTQFILGPFGGEADVEHALARLTEVLLHNPELGVGIGAATLVTAVLSWLGWTTLGGIVFLAARGDRLSEAAGGAVAAAGPLLAQGLVHAVVTFGGLMVLSVVLGPLPTPIRGIVLLVGVSLAILARDLVRAQICLHSVEKPYHPMATLRGFVEAAKRPQYVAVTGGLWGLKLALALSLTPLAVQALGPSNVSSLLRVLVAAGLALSFLRMSWVTHWLPVELEPSAESPSDAEASVSGASSAEA